MERAGWSTGSEALKESQDYLPSLPKSRSFLFPVPLLSSLHSPFSLTTLGSHSLVPSSRLLLQLGLECVLPNEGTQ